MGFCTAEVRFFPSVFSLTFCSSASVIPSLTLRQQFNQSPSSLACRLQGALRGQSHTEEVAKVFTVEVEVAITCVHRVPCSHPGCRTLRTAKAVWSRLASNMCFALRDSLGGMQRREA